jgi:hypothetical protein
LAASVVAPRVEDDFVVEPRKLQGCDVCDPAIRRVLIPKARPIGIVERFHTLHPLPIVVTDVVGDCYFVGNCSLWVEALVRGLVPHREVVPCGEQERGAGWRVDDEAGGMPEALPLKAKLQPEGLNREERAVLAWYHRIETRSGFQRMVLDYEAQFRKSIDAPRNGKA